MLFGNGNSGAFGSRVTLTKTFDKRLGRYYRWCQTSRKVYISGKYCISQIPTLFTAPGREHYGQRLPVLVILLS